jgi:hypothetical protein
VIVQDKSPHSVGRRYVLRSAFGVAYCVLYPAAIFRIEAALADPEICRIRRIPDTNRSLPAVCRHNQTAVKADIHPCLWGGIETETIQYFQIRQLNM